MALNEYQKKWLIVSGQADHIEFSEGQPNLSDLKEGLSGWTREQRRI